MTDTPQCDTAEHLKNHNIEERFLVNNCTLKNPSEAVEAINKTEHTHLLLQCPLTKEKRQSERVR